MNKIIKTEVAYVENLARLRRSANAPTVHVEVLTETRETALLHLSKSACQQLFGVLHAALREWDGGQSQPQPQPTAVPYEVGADPGDECPAP